MRWVGPGTAPGVAQRGEILNPLWFFWIVIPPCSARRRRRAAARWRRLRRVVWVAGAAGGAAMMDRAASRRLVDGSLSNWMLLPTPLVAVVLVTVVAH